MNDLTKKIQDLDLVAEQRLLSMEEWAERLEVEKNLERLFILEDLQWKQKAGKNWILQWDANSHFFPPVCQW